MWPHQRHTKANLTGLQLRQTGFERRRHLRRPEVGIENRTKGAALVANRERLIRAAQIDVDSPGNLAQATNRFDAALDDRRPRGDHLAIPEVQLIALDPSLAHAA